MPSTTRKRKRSMGSNLSLNRSVATNVSENVPSVPPVEASPSETTPPALLPNMLTLNVQLINTHDSSLHSHVGAEVASPVNVEPIENYSATNDVTTGTCGVPQSDPLEVPRGDLPDALSDGDSESESSRKRPNNSQTMGPSGDKAEAPSCAVDFNVDLFVKSALSCGMCKMPYSTVANRWKPLQFKPCSHLACFNCIDEFLVECSVKRVPLYKITCRHCNQKITQITCNESVCKLIQAFIDAGVVAETSSSSNEPNTVESNSDSSLESRKLEALSDFKLTRKTLSQFPSASFDPPPVAPPSLRPPSNLLVDTSLFSSESSSPASPTEVVTPGDDRSSDTMVDPNSVSTNPISQ